MSSIPTILIPQNNNDIYVDFQILEINYMTNSSNQPEKSQKTWIQRHPKISVASISGVAILVGGATLTILGHLGAVAQLCDFVGIKCPGKNIGVISQLPKSQWIGVRIEEVHDKLLPEQKSATTLIQTDKLANKPTAVLKNNDEPAFHKYNSGNYAVTLRRAMRDKEQLCLKISGERIPRKSEFMNIIQINAFPTNKNYDALSPDLRDQVCQAEPNGVQTVLNDPREYM